MAVFSFAFLFLGELLVIYSELAVSHKFQTENSQHRLLFMLAMILLMAAAGSLLLLGFMVGIEEYKSIWVVNVISTSLVIIIEPIIAYGIYRYAPDSATKKSLVFAVLGLLSAMLL
ncbi:hypothetical protein [Marinomonas spartinae]|uniref:hypothetical protein n=1 Tax=Marinomonas spartinae TaxID=1792290 RepID=UPI0018F26887|nr:hypothetical protein [Marinomonas spartinae]MBJ7553463.1 hypothetical protein [Marinomonas spartinae]